MSEITYKIPLNSDSFKGEFIVFFTDEENPEVLFHSVVADEAYQKAEEIFLKEGKRPTVSLVQNTQDNMAQVLSFV